MAPSEPNQNPFQGEFFTSGLADRFVRESVQNSLDARAGEAPVTVRFTISGPDGAVAKERAGRYLDGLGPHLRAALQVENANLGLDLFDSSALGRRAALLDGPIPFLCVEDFGTTGLLGDVAANDIEAQGNDFWGFFRSIGISPKGSDAGGSWGLGKWVFPDASQLNVFLGVTRRAGSDSFLLMGQAMLKLHEVAGRKYPPVGFFALRSHRKDDTWLPMPATWRGDRSHLPQGEARGGGLAAEGDTRRQIPAAGGGSEDDAVGRFVREAMRDFGLRPTGAPGTSVVIPHPMDDLAEPANLARAAIEQYFLPVVAGDLIVEIEGPGASSLRIDAETIKDQARRAWRANDRAAGQDGEAIVRVIELAEWGLSREGDLVRATGRRRKPAVSDDRVPPLRNRFHAGERLGFEVRTRVKGRPNSFRVFVERDESRQKGSDYYVRGYLHIPRMNYLAAHRARALVIVDNTSDLGHLLRDAEGPSHEVWRPTAARLREKGWPNAAERVREVQNAAARILDQIAAPPKEVHRDALADLFPGRMGKWPGTGTGLASAPNGEPRRPAIQVNPLPGGFEVAPVAGQTELAFDDGAGALFDVRIAYDVARGSIGTAFSRFARGLKAGCADFSLRNGGLRMSSLSCEPEVMSENEVRIRLVGPDFRFRVSGFDDRDLVVKVVPFAEGADAAGGEENAR